MKRTALYSSRRSGAGPIRGRLAGPGVPPWRRSAAGAAERGNRVPSPTPVPDASAAADAPSSAATPRWRRLAGRHERALLVTAGAVAAVLLVTLHALVSGSEEPITQRDIDAAVQYTLENMPGAPAPASVAYATVRPSVVRVERLGMVESEISSQGVGTGVVIEEGGVILTNLHVVHGADRVGVVFADGSESEAEIIATQPENDLAVLQALELPADLVPATMTSTRDLHMGEPVFAVGHPFGIGPSLSAGVVSGLRRNYVSPEGDNVLTNLIQFDAAANPGNSGGPLVTSDGSVVGIVTGILNPTEQRVFIGIGFAVPIENAAAAAGENPF